MRSLWPVVLTRLLTSITFGNVAYADTGSVSAVARSPSSIVVNASRPEGAEPLSADSIAEMRAIPTAGISDASEIKVAGYHANGDGGGGNFSWSQTSTAFDDGGVTIKPTGATVGRWVRHFKGPINVRWYGAHGDGVSDDTKAIQAAINYALSIGGGSVNLPAGSYYLNSITKNPYCLILGSNLCIYGDGISATRIISGPAIQPVTQALFGNFVSSNDSYENLPVSKIAGTASQGQSSLLLADSTQASRFSVGDYIYIRGAPIAQVNAEQNVIAAVDSTKGIIGLRYPLSKSYTNDGIHPFGAVDVQLVTFHGISFRDFSVTSPVCIFGLQQIVGMSFSNLRLTVTAKARDVPTFSTGYLRKVTFNNLDLSNSTPIGTEGTMQIARDSIDLKWMGCTFWTGGSPLIEFTEQCADIQVEKCDFSGTGYVAGSSNFNVEITDCHFDSDNSAPNPLFYMSGGGSPSYNFKLRGNTILDRGIYGTCGVAGPNETISGNTISSNCGDTPGTSIIRIGYHQDGTVVSDNSVTATNPDGPIAVGLVTSHENSHRVSITGNRFMGSSTSARSSCGILVNDDGRQKAGPVVAGNSISNFTYGINLTNPKNEGVYKLGPNKVSAKCPYPNGQPNG
jgi:hypothetical protein